MRVLIMTVSAGSGHTKAAEALLEEASARYGKENCMLVDTYKYAHRFLHNLFINGYIKSLKIMPKIFAKAYEMTNDDDSNNSSKLSRTINSLFSGKIKKLIQSFDPSIILTTHYFPSQMLSNMVKAGNLSIPFVTVTTDYAIHSIWITEYCNAYVIAHKSAAEKLLHKGVSPDAIFPVGIPVRTQFCKKGDKEVLRKELGFGNLPTFLLMGGGVGMGNIKDMFQKLLPFADQLQLMVVCGRNQRLLRQLEKECEEKEYDLSNVRLFGYVDEIANLMNAADFIMTKPGGITISEALCLEIPLILIDALPGQEEANELHFINNGAAYKLPSDEGFSTFIKDVMDNSFQRDQIKEAQKRLSKPNAAKDTLDLCESFVVR